MMRPMDDELVTVRNCNYLHEAEFIKSVLEAEGISAEIPISIWRPCSP